MTELHKISMDTLPKRILMKTAECWREDRITFVLITAYGLLIIPCLTLFIYGDIVATMDNSILLTEALFKGRLLDYYQYTIENASTVWAATYDLPIYIIFAIWEIPVYIAKTFFGASVFSYPALLWTKGLIVFSSVVSLVYLHKICLLLTADKKSAKKAALLFILSSHFFVNAMLIVGYDMISVTFTLIGLYYFLCGNKKRFVLFFAIAVTLKMFALFLFIPLLLLMEKRPLKLLLYLVSGLLPLILCKLVFHYFDNSYSFTADGFMSLNFTPRLLAGTLQLGHVSLPLFLTIFLVVCAYCYTQTGSKKYINTLSVYMCFLVYTTFCLTVSIHPYWLVILPAFTVIVIMTNPEKYTVNLFLDFLGSIGAFVVLAMIFDWVFGTGMNIGRWVGVNSFMPISNPKYGSIKNLLIDFGIDKYTQLYCVLFVGCSVALLMINFPKKSVIAAMSNPEIKSNSESIAISDEGLFPFNAHLALRIGWLIMIVGLIFATWYIPADQAVLDTSEYERIPVMITRDTIIEQTICFDDDFNASNLELLFYNSAESKAPWFNSVEVTILDDYGKPVFQSREGVYQLYNERMYAYKLKGLSVRAKETYTIRITPRDFSDDQSISIGIVRLPTMNAQLYINGEPREGSLFMSVDAKAYKDNSIALSQDSRNATIDSVNLFRSEYDSTKIIVEVTVTNTGESVWNRESRLYLACMSAGEWVGNFLLPKTAVVNPGERYTFYGEISATDDVASYNFIMAYSNQGGFGEWSGMTDVQ